MEREETRRGGGSRQKWKGWRREGETSDTDCEGRDRTCDVKGGEGNGKEEGEGKRVVSVQPPDFNSWRCQCADVKTRRSP